MQTQLLFVLSKARKSDELQFRHWKVLLMYEQAVQPILFWLQEMQVMFS